MGRRSRIRSFSSVLFVTVTATWSSLVSAPVPPSTQGNILQDRNADGRLDALQLEFVSALSQEYLEQVLDSVVLTWPDSAGRLMRLVSHGSDFIPDPERPRRISRAFPDYWPVAANLTQLGSLRYPFSYGEVFCYAAGNAEPFPIRVAEALPPVITEARLSPGSSGEPDTIRVTLSEPVRSLTSQDVDLLEFRSPASTQAVALHAEHVRWIEPTRLIFLISENQKPRPRDGDSLRLNPASVQDLSGNKANPAYHLIQGLFPFDLQILSKATFPGWSWAQRPLFQIQFFPFGDSLPEQDWLGVGMDIGSAALESTIRSRLRTGSDAPVDPSKIEWQMEVRVYGTDGQPVHHSRLNISCTDPRFASGPPFLAARGNCIEFPARVFLRWNLKASNGRSAASGAYIARISSRLLYDRQAVHTITPDMAEGNSIWGILRSENGTP